MVIFLFSKYVTYFQANYILSIDFTDVMLCQEAISSSRTVFYYWSYLSIFKYEANMPCTVFVHGDSSLERPIREKITVFIV